MGAWVRRYTVRSGKRIALTFEEARVGGIRISDTLESLLAPALLPRGSLQHAVLLAIKQVRAGPGRAPGVGGWVGVYGLD